MNDYLVFVGAEHYPEGGWEDFIGRYPTLEEARAAAAVEADKGWWWHIVHDYKILERG